MCFEVIHSCICSMWILLIFLLNQNGKGSLPHHSVLSTQCVMRPCMHYSIIIRQSVYLYRCGIAFTYSHIMYKRTEMKIVLFRRQFHSFIDTVCLRVCVCVHAHVRSCEYVRVSISSAFRVVHIIM